MSGHSKWASIKHKKGALDAKRGKIFTKLIKELTVAARMGGGDPDGNPRLRTAILAAKAENMPKDNIDRAIKKGTGELEGVSYEEFTYEGYGPGGVAILVDGLTDNKNRTVAELKYAFDRHGGALGAPGCAACMFSKKGLITFEKGAVEEEKLIEVALDAGAEDVQEGEKEFDVLIDPTKFEAVKKAFDDKGFKYVFGQVTLIPQNTIKLEGKKAEQMMSLVETLEDSDDISHVYANFDVPDEVIEAAN
ncbi:MAG: YebC/PmpR family DNA-binding transcriptional regulator [Desulfobacteraceae bacterium]|nr:MAG: YebC/PmpR family DNA-binding transcriptional regulator [Desulfobacteraceae bacterium]